MADIEAGRYNIEFNPNNIIVDKARTKEILKTFKKWADYRYNWKIYHSFSRMSGNRIETVFIEEQRLRQRIDTDREIARSRKKIEEFKIETSTQIQLQNLEQNMNGSQSTPEAQWNGNNGRTMEEIQAEAQAMDNAKLQLTIDDLLEKYKDLKKWIRGAEWNWNTKRTLKSWLWENIESLERMKRDLNKHSYTNLSTYKARVWELIYYFEHYEQVRQLVVLWQQTSDIHTIIDSKQDAKRARRQEVRDAKYQQEMNDILHDVALTSMWNNDMERYEEYLEAVVNWQVEPSSHPFYTAHRQSFNIIQNTNPSLYNTLVPTGTWRINYNTYCQNGEQNNNSCHNRVCCWNKNTFRRFWERFSNMLEQIFPNGMNRDPRQKEAWTNIWSLLAVWWTIFMWIKAIKSLKKDEKWERHWWAAAGWTAWALAILYNDKVFQTLQDALNIHPAEKTRAVTDIFNKYWFTDAQAANIADKYVWAPVATLSALHFIPIYDLYTQHILENNNNGISFNYNNYEKYLNSLGFSNEQKQQLLSHWQRLRDNDRIWLGLWTFWINTMSDLQNAANWSQTTTLGELPQVQEWRNNNVVDRISNWVNAKLFEHGLRAKDPESLDQITKEYDAENNPSNIKKLIVKWMKAWLLEISAEDKEYNLEDMLNNPNVDIENMTMKWFKHSWWNEIKFDNYWELFDTVYITDRIKYNFAWRPAKSTTPFRYGLWGKWKLKFDDTERYQVLKNDTRILKIKTMLFNLKTIGKNKEFYANYLNERRQGTRKFDLTSYPLSQSIWIDFYWDQQEIIDLEKFLTDLKAEYWNTYGTWSWKPYEINILGQMLFTDSDDNVDKVNVKLNKFKTIWHNSENKEKLLTYLNDPRNWMYLKPTV